MKASRAQKVRLGAFLLSAGLLLVGGVGLLVGVKLTRERQHYFMLSDDSIAGVEKGSAVKVLGVQQGSVSELSLERGQARLRLSIDAGVELREGASGYLAMQGLTGMRYVELRPGPPDAPPLEPGSRIPVTGSGLLGLDAGVGDVLGRVSELVSRVNALLDEDGRTRVKHTLGQLDRVLELVADYLEHNREGVDEFFSEGTELIRELRGTVAETRALVRDVRPVARATADLLKQGRRTLARLPVEDLARRADRILAEVEEALDQLEPGATAERVSTAAASASDTLERVDRLIARSGDDVRALLASLRRASADLEHVLREIRSHPSVLVRGRPENRP